MLGYWAASPAEPWSACMVGTSILTIHLQDAIASLLHVSSMASITAQVPRWEFASLAWPKQGSFAARSAMHIYLQRQTYQHSKWTQWPCPKSQPLKWNSPVMLCTCWAPRVVGILNRLLSGRNDVCMKVLSIVTDRRFTKASGSLDQSRQLLNLPEQGQRKIMGM